MEHFLRAVLLVFTGASPAPVNQKPALNEGVNTLWVAPFGGEETGSMRLSSVLKVTQLGGESQDSDTDLSSLLLSHP